MNERSGMNNILVKYKIGDKVKAIKGKEAVCGGCKDHEFLMITQVSGSIYTYSAYDKNGKLFNNCSCYKDEDLEFYSSQDQVINKNMNLIEKYYLMTKGEPERSFFKAGITDKQDLLTTEGSQLFLNFLLNKFGADFKKEVVDPILAEEENK